MSKTRKTPDQDSKVEVRVSPRAFLLELEKRHGNAEAACAELHIDPKAVYGLRDRDAEFREDWERVVHSLKQETQDLFVAAYARSHKVVLACREAGIPRETVYRLRQANPNFQLDWRRIEDQWEWQLGRPGGDPDRNTDQDIEVIRHRLRGAPLDQVIELYRRVLAWPAESIPRSALRPKLGIPPTSVQKDYDEWAPRGARRGAQSAGERVEFSREYLIELVVYRYVPGSDARRAPRKTTKRT